jgi:lysophospholipase L1-like esterase
MNKYTQYVTLAFCLLFTLMIALNLSNLKTLYLVLITTPYERTIPGAPKILVLGDSTAYGTGADKPEESVAGLIGQDYQGYTIENNSVNGRTIGELGEAVSAVYGSYQMILLQIGGNDILQKREVAEVETELRAIVSHLSDHTDNLVMMSSGNVGGAERISGEQATQYTELTRNFRDMFIKVGEDTPLTYVDLFLEPEDDIISNNPDIYLASDGLHPSSAGYALWYETLKPTITPILRD